MTKGALNAAAEGHRRGRPAVTGAELPEPGPVYRLTVGTLTLAAGGTLLVGMLQVARVCDVPPHMLMDERDSGSAALINGPVASVYCRTCHRTSPLTLEALSAPGDGKTPPA